MNPVKQLRMEYDGIFGEIDSYTSDSVVMNTLVQLKLGLENGDYDIIEYTLDVLIDWYQRNISNILHNEFVSNPETHTRNFCLLEDIKSRLTQDDCVLAQGAFQSSDVPVAPMIFISHKSDDKLYGNALRDFLSGLGVPNDRIIYTSHPLHKIPLGKNIYDYLRSNINSNVFMIILWSDKYLESPACLNEMGAAWVVQSDYTNIYVPEFSFGNPKYRECAVDTAKMGAVLNGDEHCRASMIELKNKIAEMFNLSIDEQTVMFLLDKLTQDIVNARGKGKWMI